MMRLFAVAALCCTSAVVAAPTNPNALEPVLDKPAGEENPSEMMLELMQAMMKMQASENEGQDSGLGDLTNLMGQATELIQDIQKGDVNDPQHMQTTMMNAAMKMFANSGIEGINIGEIMGVVGEMASGDPTKAVMSLIDMGVKHSGLGLEEGDPLIKLAKSGARTMINGEVVPDDNPFAHLHDVVAPTVGENKDNALMQLIMGSIKAAGDDQSGDPLNAVVNYVLEHPEALQNPIVSNAKLIHGTIIDEDLHHTSPLLTTAKQVMDTISHPEIHEQSDLLKTIIGVVQDPSAIAKDSPLAAAAAQIHETLINADAGAQQESMTKMIKSFTEKVSKGEVNGIEDIIKSHPAGEAFNNAAEALQNVIENPEGADDALISKGAEVFEQITGDAASDDPVVKTAKDVHVALTTLDKSDDPILKAAMEIQKHVTDGIDGVVSDLDI